MANKRRWVDEIVLIGDTRGFVGGLAQASFALNQVGFAVGAVARGLAAPTNAAHAFQTSLNQVAAVSGATAAQMSALETQALDMGASTKFSATEAADAQSFLAMAGFEVREVMGALPATLALAAAGNLQLADAADIATNVMTGYGLGVAEVGRATDVIATVAASANTNVQQVGEAMKYAAPVASAAGMSFESAAAAVGLLSNAGIQADMAGTSLRGMITKLLNPSAEAAKIMKRLGVAVTDSTGAMRPFEAIMADFERTGLSAADAMEVFGLRAGPGTLALVGQGTSALGGLIQKLKESEGAAQDMADTQQRGLVGAMTEASSAASNLQIILGQALTPAVMAGLEAFTAGARGLGSWIRESETARVASQTLGAGVSFVAGNVGGLTRAAALLTAAYLAQRNQAVVLRVATLAWAGAVGTASGVAAGYRLLVVGTNQAMAAYRAGLLGARAAMLAKAAAVGVGTLALKAFRAAWMATGVGAIVVLVGTGLAMAWSKWGDSIKAFLAGVWNRFVGAIEAGMSWIRPLAEWAGIKLPASLDTLKFTLDGTGQGLERYADNLEGAYEQHARATEGIKAMEAAGQAVDPKLRNWTAGLERHIEKLGGTVENTDALADASGGLGVAADGAADSMEGLAGAVEDADAANEKFLKSLWESVEGIDAQNAALRRDSDASIKLLESFGMVVPSAAQVRAEFDMLTGALVEPPLAIGAVNESLLQLPISMGAAEAAARSLAPSLGDQLLGGLAETFSPAAVGATLARAFEGGGALLGGFKSLGAQAGGKLGEGLQGWLTENQSKFGGMFGGMLKGAIGMAIPIIGPALGSLAGWIGKKLFGGKPSAAVKAARQGMADVAAQIDLDMSDASTADRFAGWVAGGFKEAHARIVTFFQNVALAQGQSSEAGVQVWLRYQRAVEDGNQELADSIMQSQLDAWDAVNAGREDDQAAHEAAVAAKVEATEAAQAEELEAFQRGQADRRTEFERGLEDELSAFRAAQADKLSAAEDAAAAEIEAFQRGQADKLTLFERGLEDELSAFRAAQADKLSAAEDAAAAEIEAFQRGQADKLATFQRGQADELSAFQRGQADKLAAFRDGQAAEVAALKEVHAARVAEVRAGQAAEVAALKEVHAARLAETKEAMSAELAELERVNAERRSIIEGEIDAELEDARIRVEHRLAISRAGGDAEKIAEANAARDRAQQRLADRREFDAAMAAEEEAIRARYQAELDAMAEAERALQESNDTRLAEMETAQADELQALQDGNAERLEAMTDAQADELQALQDGNAERLQEFQRAQADELTEFKRGQADRLTEFKRGQADELQALKDAFAERLDALKTAQADELTEFKRGQADRLTEFKRGQADELQALKDHHAEVLGEIQNNRTAVTGEVQGMVDDFNAIVGTVEPLILTTIHETIYRTAGGDAGEIAPVPMAAGGLGRVSRPTLFLAGEAGPESYWFSGAQDQVRPPMGGAGGVGGLRDALAGMEFRVELAESDWTRATLERMPEEAERLL